MREQLIGMFRMKKLVGTKCQLAAGLERGQCIAES